MKKNRQFWALIAFGLLWILPVVPIALSLSELRSSIVFDSPIDWVAGKESNFKLPALNKGDYELRLESAVSDWQPMVSLTWALSEISTAREIMAVKSPEEIILTRSLGKIHIAEKTAGETNLAVSFANSNTTDRKLRLRFSVDRDVLLQKNTRMFAIFLAISLVLSLFLWKPLMASPGPNLPKLD